VWISAGAVAAAAMLAVLLWIPSNTPTPSSTEALSTWVIDSDWSDWLWADPSEPETPEEVTALTADLLALAEVLE